MKVADEHDYSRVVYDLCFCAGRVPGRECYGAITREHIISRQRIKREVPAVNKRQVRALRDSRNLLGVCLGCHLGTLTTGNPAAQVQFSDLPVGFWNFVAEYGLEGALPRHLSGYTPESAPEAA